MRTVLCIIHDSDPDLQVVDRAIRDVQEGGGRLVIAAVYDPAVERQLSERLSSRNFVGMKLTESVARITSETLQENSRAQMEAAKVRTHDAGIDAVAEHRTGPTVDEVTRLATELAPSRVFVPRVPEGLWNRLLKGSTMDALVRSVPCPVVIVE